MNAEKISMLKNKHVRFVSIMVALVLAGTVVGCGNAKEPANPPDNEKLPEQSAESKKAAPETDTDTNEIKKKDVTETELSGNMDILPDECAAKIDQLLISKSVNPSNAETLAQMADCVTFARVLNNAGVIFAGMDNRNKASLRHQILDNVLWIDSSIQEDLSSTVNNEPAVPLDVAEKLFKDFYGEEDFVPYEYERVEDGYVYPLLADGEAWHKVAHMQYFEDDDYILFTGPGFYESNGGDEEFMGYADILFAKNPDSRYGVTLLYGRYRDRRIKVASVEATSELSASGDKTYSADNLIDGDYTTVWAEGVSGTGVGETVTLHLDKEQYVYGVLICNGYTAGYDQYNNNGLITKAEADFGNGNYASEEFEGYGFEGATAENLAESNHTKLELESPVMTDTIIITITDAKSGAKYDDTCVSEILVY